MSFKESLKNISIRTVRFGRLSLFLLGLSLLVSISANAVTIVLSASEEGKIMIEDGFPDGDFNDVVFNWSAQIDWDTTTTIHRGTMEMQPVRCGACYQDTLAFKPPCNGTLLVSDPIGAEVYNGPMTKGVYIPFLEAWCRDAFTDGAICQFNDSFEDGIPHTITFVCDVNYSAALDPVSTLPVFSAVDLFAVDADGWAGDSDAEDDGAFDYIDSSSSYVQTVYLPSDSINDYVVYTMKKFLSSAVIPLAYATDDFTYTQMLETPDDTYAPAESQMITTALGINTDACKAGDALACRKSLYDKFSNATKGDMCQFLKMQASIGEIKVPFSNFSSMGMCNHLPGKRVLAPKPEGCNEANGDNCLHIYGKSGDKLNAPMEVVDGASEVIRQVVCRTQTELFYSCPTGKTLVDAVYGQTTYSACCPNIDYFDEVTPTLRTSASMGRGVIVSCACVYDASSKIDVILASVGEFCAMDSGCLSNYCSHGSCIQGVYGTGSQCQYDEQCNTNTCTGGECVVPPSSGGPTFCALEAGTTDPLGGTVTVGDYGGCPAGDSCWGATHNNLDEQLSKGGHCPLVGICRNSESALSSVSTGVCGVSSCGSCDFVGCAGTKGCNFDPSSTQCYRTYVEAFSAELCNSFPVFGGNIKSNSFFPLPSGGLLAMTKFPLSNDPKKNFDAADTSALINDYSSEFDPGIVVADFNDLDGHRQSVREHLQDWFDYVGLTTAHLTLSRCTSISGASTGLPCSSDSDCTSSHFNTCSPRYSYYSGRDFWLFNGVYGNPSGTVHRYFDDGPVGYFPSLYGVSYGSLGGYVLDPPSSSKSWTPVYDFAWMGSWADGGRRVLLLWDSRPMGAKVYGLTIRIEEDNGSTYRIVVRNNTDADIEIGPWQLRVGGDYPVVSLSYPGNYTSTFINFAGGSSGTAEVGVDFTLTTISGASLDCIENINARAGSSPLVFDTNLDEIGPLTNLTPCD